MAHVPRVPVPGPDWEQQAALVRGWIAEHPEGGYRTCARELGLDVKWVRSIGKSARHSSTPLAHQPMIAPAQAPVPPSAPAVPAPPVPAPSAPGGPRGMQWEDENRKEFLERMIDEIEADIQGCRDGGKANALAGLYRMHRQYRKELDEIRDAEEAKAKQGDMDDDAVTTGIRNTVGDMPEKHLRIFVDEYLRRHRVMLVRDPDQMEKLGDETNEEA